MSSVRVCSSCDASLYKDMIFCPKCGKKIDWSNYCSKCGGNIGRGDNFCSKCGTSASETEVVLIDNPYKKISNDSYRLSRGLRWCNFFGILFLPKVFWIAGLINNGKLKRLCKRGGHVSSFADSLKSISNWFKTALVFSIIGDIIFLCAAPAGIVGYVLIFLIQLWICSYAYSNADNILDRYKYDY